MFDFTLALLLFTVSIPGIVIVVPRSLKQLSGTIESKLPEGKKLPPMPVITLIQILQSVILVAASVALGVFFAPRVGLEAPFFTALVRGSGIVAALPNPVVVVGLSAAGSAVFLLLYYGVLRPWMGPETADAMDGFRNQLGLLSRVLYGGVVEEVLTRWGLMSFLTWLASLVLPPVAAVWVAIVVTGIIFGLGHIPSYAGAGCDLTRPLVTTMIVLNLLAGIIFGYLFWQHGLLAAIVSHMLFHLFWFPIDKARLSRQRTGSYAAELG